MRKTSTLNNNPLVSECSTQSTGFLNFLPSNIPLQPYLNSERSKAVKASHSWSNMEELVTLFHFLKGYLLHHNKAQGSFLLLNFTDQLILNTSLVSYVLSPVISLCSSRDMHIFSIPKSLSKSNCQHSFIYQGPSSWNNFLLKPTQRDCDHFQEASQDTYFSNSKNKIITLCDQF